MNKKIIVTHINPDLDATSSVWLIKRYHPDFSQSDVRYEFVPAGRTFEGRSADHDPNIVHVDTGLGKYDHHQIPEKTCAFEKIYQVGLTESWFPEYDIKALSRMCKVINDYDNFREVYYPDPTADYYDFSLSHVISGLVHTSLSDSQKINIVVPLYDALLQIMKNKMRSETDIANGVVLETKTFGKTIVMQNSNNDCMKYAQKKGFNLVARKDTKKGNVRIVSIPDDKYDLTSIYIKIKQVDSIGTWFMHQSKHMLLNGSLLNPTMKPSPISFEQLVEILRSF
jgi:hypothetical protein